MSQNEHDDEIRSIGVGDHVTLVLGDGSEFDVECTDKDRMHSRGDAPGIWEQNTWTFDHDGDELSLGILDGLSPVEGGGDAYPSHMPLVREELMERGSWNEDASLGYVREVRGDVDGGGR